MGAGDVWEISLPSSQFCCEPKTAQKIVFLNIGIYTNLLEIHLLYKIGGDYLELRITYQ